jgi:hypothetical protein
MTAARVKTSTEGGTMHITVSGEVGFSDAATIENQLCGALLISRAPFGLT